MTQARTGYVRGQRRPRRAAAWTRGLQALITYRSGRLEESVRYAQSGAEAAARSHCTAGIWLASNEAWALAALNRFDDAHAALARAGVAVAGSVSRQPEAVEVTLVSAADESARLLAWAEASNIGDLTVEQMHSDVRWIARSYLKAPTLPLFARARAIRDQAFALLAGHQRPDQSRDLYAAAGWALTLLAWISTDLGRPDAADTHARAAWVCANNADHHGLRAWIRATQHTVACWEHHFLDAARYAEDGLRHHRQCRSVSGQRPGAGPSEGRRGR